MAKRRGVRIRARFLDLACKELKIRTKNRAPRGKKILGVSPRMLVSYRTGEKRPTDKKLSAAFSHLLEIADAQGIGQRINYLLQQAIAIGSRAGPPVQVELGPGGGRAASHPLPLCAAVVERHGHSASAGEDGSFKHLMTRGNTEFAIGEFEKAVIQFERALTLAPDNISARLCAVKAHLQVPHGDLRTHFLRANDLIGTSQSTIQPWTALWVQWEFWRVVAKTRNPEVTDWNAEFLAAANDLGNLAAHARDSDDRRFAIFFQCMQAVALFRSGMNKTEATDEQLKAIENLKDLLPTLRQKRDTAARAMALKQLGNCHVFLPPPGPENLRKALSYYRAAAKCYKGIDHPTDWAMVRYSQADALMKLGQIMWDSPGETSQKKAVEYYALAERANQDAIRTLPENYRDDLGRARFNLAEVNHTWPGCDLKTEEGRRGKREKLHQAIYYYRQTLVSFPREYNKSEWALTHLPLAKAYEELADLETKDSEEGGGVESLVNAIASLKAVYSVFPDEAMSSLKRLREVYARLAADDRPAFKEIAAAT